MSLLESINTHFSSIVILWSGYLLSIGFFYLYNYKYRFTYRGKQEGLAGRCVLFVNRTICILPVALTAAFRGMYTGADTYNYWQAYLRFRNNSFWDTVTFDLTGIFYNIVRWFLGRISNGNVQIFFFFFSFFTLYLLVTTIEKWNLKNGCLALFIFYSCFGPNLLNQMRQMFAVVILLYAYRYAYNKRFKEYFVLGIFAGLFHFSALLSAIIIWILQKDKKNKISEYLFYVGICVGMFGMQYLFTILNMFMNSTKYGSLYLMETVENDVSIGFGLLLAIMPNIMPVWLFQKRLDKENRFRNTILMTLPARLAGYYSYYVYRIMYYFSIQSIIALPIIVENASKNRKYIKALIYILCIGYFVCYYVWKGQEIYFPYITYWENG